MFGFEKDKRGMFDRGGNEVLVERYKNGKVRILDDAAAVVSDDLTLIKMHYLKQGACVSSRVEMLLH